MSAAPFDVAAVVARIKDAVPGLRQVGRAADYASVRALGDFPAPCAYVLLAREKADKYVSGHATPGTSVPVAQPTHVTFGVIVAVRNYRESGAGAQGADELRETLGAIRGALLGWVPALPGALPCELVQGDLKEYDRGTTLWSDVYQTRHILRSAP